MMRPLALALVLIALSMPRGFAESEDEAWIRTNKDLLKHRLSDPESARFRHVFLSRKAGVPAACGEVDAKRPAGAYAGFQRFVGAGSVGVFFPGDVDDFEALWAFFCE